MDLRPLCKYGEKCYRQNPQHQKQYKHPKRKRDDETGEEVKRKKVEEEEDTVIAASSKTSAADEESISDLKKNDTTTVEVESEQNTEDADNSEPEELVDIESPADIKENIKQKYLSEFGEDFYEMWEFCKQEHPEKPSETFKKTLGFTLVGPYDILAGKTVKKNSRGKRPNYLLHWRYYYDPPEFTTVINGDKESQFHIGYYRDDPSELPVFVAANAAKHDGKIAYKGPNLFSVLKGYLEEKTKSKDVTPNVKKDAQSLLEKLCKYSKSKNISVDYKSEAVKAREKKVVCKTLHGAGIVVPVDENEVGYRPVPETPADLRKMFKKIADSKTEKERDKNFEPLQEIITYIQFANDECDYGEGLELGLDLFTYGGDVFHPNIMSLLPLAYQLLRRQEYGKIIEAHMKRRRHTADLSELD